MKVLATARVNERQSMRQILEWRMGNKTIPYPTVPRMKTWRCSRSSEELHTGRSPVTAARLDAFLARVLL
jgi:hypothetical protein